jgi:ADP-ribose pyrophosphatase
MVENDAELDKPLAQQIGWRRVTTRYPFANRFFRIRQDRVRLADGEEIDYAYTESKGAVFIVPVTRSGEIILIRQYRYPSDDWCWEVPAGSLGDHADALEDAARRELMEEIGATCDEMVYVTWYYGATGKSNIVCHVMLARGTERNREPEPEATELIEVHPIPIQEALARARGGRIRDGLSALALLLCEPYLKV